MSRNLIARIAVAVVAVPIILWICYEGGYWLFGMVSLLALLGMAEFLINEGYRAKNLFFWFGLVIVALILASRSGISTQWFLWLQILFGGVSGVLVFFLISGMLLATGTRPPPELFKQHSRLVWGVAYIGLLYPYVYQLGTGYNEIPGVSVTGGDWLLFLFGLLWVGDTAAMGIGSWLGRHKLAPAVSPNKTVEGFVGGIIGAIVIGIVMYFWKFNDLAIYHILILSVGCSIFGQLGDLVESMWKRSLGIKDSSAIIPGHGGVLDRFDSLLFAAPFMFYYKLLIIVSASS
ncbi:MAG: phosphatidate cytidylyltransferase [candidate division Zixibacteria bacterium]|nr:phosphatidate cytidylyltransferase [candidate division Zixibacteria bacterium]